MVGWIHNTSVSWSCTASMCLYNTISIIITTPFKHTHTYCALLFKAILTDPLAPKHCSTMAIRLALASLWTGEREGKRIVQALCSRPTRCRLMTWGFNVRFIICFTSTHRKQSDMETTRADSPNLSTILDLRRDYNKANVCGRTRQSPGLAFHVCMRCWNG